MGTLFTGRKQCLNRQQQSEKELPHEWVWDILGVILGLVILVAAYFVWQAVAINQQQPEQSQVIATPATSPDKPYLLQEVDGRYKLMTQDYTYYLSAVTPEQEKTISIMYDSAVKAVFEYLASEGGISSSYLVSRQDVMESVDIYVYDQINSGVNQSLSYQEMLVDWQNYQGDAALLVPVGMLQSNTPDALGKLFYQMICQCLRLLSINYDNADQAVCYGWRQYDFITEQEYGKAIDAGTALWLGDQIYQAYQYYVLDAPAIETQAPYTALYQMAQSLYQFVGQDMIGWYIKNDVESMAQAFQQGLQPAAQEYQAAKERSEAIAKAASKATGADRDAESQEIAIFQSTAPWVYFCQLTDPFDYAISGQAPADAAARYQEAVDILSYFPKG